MSDILVACAAVICFLAFVSGCTYSLSEQNKNNNQTERELNTQCLSNNGSILFDQSGRRQCIRFAK